MAGEITSTTLGSKQIPWNKGKLTGAKPPLRPKHVWAIRTKLQVDGRTRDLAMFNLAIDSKLRGRCPGYRGTSGGLIHPGRADVLCPSRFAELTGAAEAHNICSFPGLLAAEARGFKRGYAAGKSKNDCEINGESRTLPPPVGRVGGRSLPDAGADNNLAARTQLIASEAGSRTARSGSSPLSVFRSWGA